MEAEMFSGLWKPFATYQFGISCVAIMSIMWTLKKAVGQAAPTIYVKGWFQALMTLMNLGLGAVVALPKGYLVGETYGQRLLTGLCAGFLSHFVYSGLIKRFTGDKIKTTPASGTPTTPPTS